MVGQHLGGRAAEAEYHQRAEHVVVGHADDHLGAAGDHRLHQDAAEPGTEPHGQPAVGGAYLGRGVQVEFHRAGVGLVHQSGHFGLEHHWPGHGVAGHDGYVFARDRGRVDQLYPVAAEQFGGLGGR